MSRRRHEPGGAHLLRTGCREDRDLASRRSCPSIEDGSFPQPFRPLILPSQPWTRNSASQAAGPGEPANFAAASAALRSRRAGLEKWAIAGTGCPIWLRQREPGAFEDACTPVPGALDRHIRPANFLRIDRMDPVRNLPPWYLVMELAAGETGDACREQLAPFEAALAAGCLEVSRVEGSAALGKFGRLIWANRLGIGSARLLRARPGCFRIACRPMELNGRPMASSMGIKAFNRAWPQHRVRETCATATPSLPPHERGVEETVRGTPRLAFNGRTARCGRLHSTPVCRTDGGVWPTAGKHKRLRWR